MQSASDIVRVCVKFTTLGGVVILSACGLRPDAPEGGFPVSDAARVATYPELLDASTLAAALDGVPLADAEGGNLQARAADLQARGAALSRRTLIDADERAALAAAAAD